VAGERGDDATLTALLSPLDDLAEAASEAGHATIAVEALLLEAIAVDGLGNTDTAVAAVSRAARIAEPEGIVQPFLDEGASLLPALKSALTRGEKPRFLRSLIAAFQAETGETPPAVAANRLLIEPLSPRELEVLELVAQGKTNQEVGEELFISLSTVKKHLNNLFGKLTARNRTEALRRARDLGLL
jgi:LuxR family maltose regulon positive regulatory protein